MHLAAQTAFDGSDAGKDEKCRDIHHDDCRTDRRAEQNRRDNTEKRADDRNTSRAERDGFEAFKYAHRGQRRKNHQRGNQKRSDKRHGNHDYNSNNHRDNQVDYTHFCPRRACKALVKGDGEDFVIKACEHYRRYLNKNRDRGR